MTPRRFALSTLLVVFAFGLAVTAQAPPTPSAAPVVPAAPTAPATPAVPDAPQVPLAQTEPTAQPAPSQPPDPDAPDDETRRRLDVVRIGQDVTVGEGEEVHDLVVIMGNATVDGHVSGDLVAVMGTVRLGSMAVVDGNVVSVAGGITAAEGAIAGKDVVSVGGSLDAPPSFGRRGDRVIIDPSVLGMRFAGLVPYLTRGLLWGRPIVPDLGWVWGMVGFFFLVYLVINVFVAAPVRTVSAVLAEKTLTSLGIGLLVLLLFGPVSLLLAISVAGLLVIPFVTCAVMLAALVGKVGALRWVGLHLMRDETADAPLRSIAVFALGFAVVSLAYMVPVLGFVIWALLSALGLGAVTLAVIAAYRREHPPSPTAPVVPPLPAGDGPYATATEAPIAAALASEPSPGPRPPGTHDMLALPRAAFRDRLAALVLDLILVGLVVQMLGPLRGGRMFALGLLIYHVGFWTWKQTTIGGIICHLRIARMDGSSMRFADGLVRGLSSIFSVVVFGLGFLWVLRDPERQAWHDKIAGTYVVTVPRHWPI
ncbi:MAG: RDD family protein [Vicinamibacterales bacterium]